MCSFLTQIVYGIMMLITLALTAGGLFSNDWVEVGDKKEGLLCVVDSTAHGVIPDGVFCDGWWNKLDAAQRTVVVCLILAIFIEIFALVWNFFTLCACCCKKYLIHPLSAISLLIVILLAISVITFAIVSGDTIQSLERAINQASTGQPGQLGSSFIIVCCALALSILNTIVASLAICFAERCV